MTTGILQQIDQLAALCPCGDNPRPGDRYCSDDCVPNYRSVHTTSDTDGTQMRWRPNLVAEEDDRERTLIAEFPVGRDRPGGRPRGQVFAYPGYDLHLRVDDGHRYVGIDVDAANAGDPDLEPGLRRELDPVWERLERELCDPRRVEEDPWADVAARWFYAAENTRVHSGDAVYHRPDGTVAPHAAYQRLCAACGQRGIPARSQRPVPGAEPIEENIHSFGMPQPVRSTFVVAAEVFDLCTNCGHAFPGPSLRVTEQRNHTADSTTWRMVLGDRKAGWQAFDDYIARVGPDAIQRRLDQVEWQLLADYAQHHPERPDVIAWRETCDAGAADLHRTMLTDELRQVGETMRPGRVFIAPLSSPPGIPLDPSTWQELGRTLSHASDGITEAFRGVIERVMTSGSIIVARPRTDVADDREPGHPLARMNARRQNASHGPERDQRPPRQLGLRGR